MPSSSLRCLLASPAHPISGQPRTAATLRIQHAPPSVDYVFVTGRVPKAPSDSEYAVSPRVLARWTTLLFDGERRDDVDLEHHMFWYLPQAASAFWTRWLPGLLERRLPRLAAALERKGKPWIQENDTSTGEFLKGYTSSEGRLRWLIELSADVLNSNSNKAVITWSRWAAKGFVADGVDEKKVKVVPLPYKVSERAKMRLDLQGPRENGGGEEPSVVGCEKRKHPLVLFVGADYWRKGGDLVPKVMREVRKEVADAQLVYVGNVPEEQARSFREDWIEVYPFMSRQKLLSLYPKADVLFMPTRSDAYGLSLIEAMAEGVPVVSTRVNAIPEIVCQDCGYLANVDDSDAMAKHIVQVLSDRDLRAKMGLGAIKKVEAEHNPQDVSKKLLGIYEEAIGS